MIRCFLIKTKTKIQPPFWLLDSLVPFTVPPGWLPSHPWLFPSSKTYWIAKPQICFHWQFIGALCRASYHHFLLEMSPPGALVSLDPSCLPWLLADSFWPVLPPWTWGGWASSPHTVSLGYFIHSSWNNSSFYLVWDFPIQFLKHQIFSCTSPGKLGLNDVFRKIEKQLSMSWASMPQASAFQKVRLTSTLLTQKSFNESTQIGFHFLQT